MAAEMAPRNWLRRLDAWLDDQREREAVRRRLELYVERRSSRRMSIARLLDQL